MFGENKVLTYVLPIRAQYVEQNAESRDAVRKRLAGGDFNFWSSNVQPISSGEQRWAEESIVRLAGVYQESAESEGYKRWGIKEPEVNSQVLQSLNGLFLNARFVFLYRDLKDVLRSYRSRRWLNTLEQCGAIATQWVRGMELTLALQAQASAFVVRYESLLGNREAECKRIEEYLGVPAFKRDVFDHKVNTFAGDEAVGHASNEYIEPSELPDEFKALALKIASPMLQKLDYATDW